MPSEHKTVTNKISNNQLVFSKEFQQYIETMTILMKLLIKSQHFGTYLESSKQIVML